MSAHEDNAMRGGWQDLAAEWAPRPTGWHRHFFPADRFSRLERQAQNRSLGWPEHYAVPEGGGDALHLHPMREDIYLYVLAMQFEELAPRLAEMQAEMRARPEEYGDQCYFNLGLWNECGPVQEDLGKLAHDVERGLASFLSFVGTQGCRSQDFHRRNALSGFQLWSRRSLAAFSTWARNPWFCDLRGQSVNDFSDV